LARAAGRRKEIAVRLALGASRFQIIRQLLTESLLLALLGAGAGLLLAPWLYELLFAFQPGFEIERSMLQGSLDGRVLGFTVLTAILSGVLFGSVPAWQSARISLIPALKDAASGLGQHERRWNARSALVVAQVALALVMLVGAGLLVRSLQRLFAIDPGFRAEHLLIVPLELPRATYAANDEAGRRAASERYNQYFAQVAERVKTLPGVESATTAAITPFSNMIASTSVVIEGWQPQSGENLGIDDTGVGPGYHELMGIPLIEGRGFTEQDHANAPGVVIINETFARQYFPNQRAVGKRLSLGQRGQPWLEIIGVTRDHRLHNLREAPLPHLDLPALQHPYGSSARLVVRTKLDPLTVLPSVRREALALNPQVTMNAPTTIYDEMKDSIAAARMASTLTSLFGLTALLLAAIGLYGVMSQAVSRRTREIGIRIALGAERRDVLRLVLKQGLWLTALGLALGLLAALWLTRLIQTMLYGVGTTDPVTFGLVAALLAAVALVACYLPARRATKVDPMIALRCD
jgi:predicted permease